MDNPYDTPEDALKELRANAYSALRIERNMNDAQALAVVETGRKYCDSCGLRYEISHAEIVAGEFLRCCPACTLTDIVTNGDLTQQQARAALTAMEVSHEQRRGV